MTEPPDDLADLLHPSPAVPTPALRDAVLRQTERHLARIRLARRVARAALVAGVFAAGGVIGWYSRPERVHTIELAGTGHSVVVPVPLPVPVPVPDRSSTVPVQPLLAASAAEMRAEQRDDPRAAAILYRQAGDAFLRDQDYTNATRCYRLYLDRAGESGLVLDSADSWLLVSLKNAAFREKFDVTKNDG
jgi:hypothetical protein